MKKILTFLKTHRKLFTFTLVLVIGVAVWMNHPDIALAAEGDDDPGKLVRDINEIFNLLIRVSAAWLWPVIMMIGSLLDNDLVFGGAMGERLLDVWVQVRNLVNVAFVLILLAIAAYNVLGIGEEGGSSPLALKQVLPKFVIALIAVNFSFLAARVVLDFTSVLTGVVFALPSTTIDSNYNMQAQTEAVICGTNSKEVPMRATWCEDGKLTERARNFFSRLDRNNITLSYAIRFGRAPQLKFIKDGLKDVGQLGFNIIFNAVLYVVYAVSFIVLFLVLLFRVVALWVGVVLSPLLALGIVLPNLKELAGEAGGLQEKFVANAIAPIKIGLVLSIGYIMLDGFEADKSVHGDLLASNVLSAVDPSALPTDIGDLQQLMIAVAVVVIIWVGVFAGADKTAASGLTNIIKDHMESFGKWTAKLPAYAQVIPTSPGEKMTFAQLMDTARHYKEEFHKERGVSPFRPGMQDMHRIKRWQDAAAAGVGSLSEALHEDLKPLGRLEGLDVLRKFAKDNGDEQLFKALENASAADVRGTLDKMYNATGSPLVQLMKNQIGTIDQAKAQFDRDNAQKAETPPTTTAPSLKTADEVKSALASKEPNQKAENLKKDALIDYTPEEIQLLKDLRRDIVDAIVKPENIKDGKLDPAFKGQLAALRTLQDEMEILNVRTDFKPEQTDHPINEALKKARDAKIQDGLLQAVVTGTSFTDPNMREAILQSITVPAAASPPGPPGTGRL